MVLSGEGADEVYAGYLYFHKVSKLVVGIVFASLGLEFG
jgi:hypothetical protein